MQSISKLDLISQVPKVLCVNWELKWPWDPYRNTAFFDKRSKGWLATWDHDNYVANYIKNFLKYDFMPIRCFQILKRRLCNHIHNFDAAIIYREMEHLNCCLKRWILSVIRILQQGLYLPKNWKVRGMAKVHGHMLPLISRWLQRNAKLLDILKERANLALGTTVTLNVET